MREHLKFPALNVPSFPVSSLEDADNAAERARQFWGLGIDGPILQIVRVMELAGVIVVPHMADCKKVDAFSRNGRTCVVFLNKGIPSTSRWNFDMAHECAHLVMHGGIPTGDEQTEREADRFASAFLLPRRAFTREFQQKPFSWGHIFDMKRRWQTSAAAIVRRAYDLGLIGAVQYRRSFQYMSFKGWKTNGEPMEPNFHEPELLKMGIEALKARAVSLERLCAELHFSEEAFACVTGVSIPTREQPKPSLIAFPISSMPNRRES
jgi:Zn-dependent peptidase ImmA (M78 family)